MDKELELYENKTINKLAMELSDEIKNSKE